MEEVAYENAMTFPLYRFLNTAGSLNRRKIHQLKPWRQQAAKNAFFIQQALRYHKPMFYGYREVRYVRNDAPVRIWCPDHEGWFEQRAGTHMDGHGCPLCSRRVVDRVTEYGTFVVPASFHQWRLLEDGRLQFFNRFKTLEVDINDT